MIHVKHEGRSFWSKTVSHLKDSGLRLIFSKFAENSAYTSLKTICDASGISYSERDLRTTLQLSIVPAYHNGWLTDVVTLNQLQKWVERRCAIAFSDPMFDELGFQQYFLMHCLSEAYSLKKVSATFILEQSPAIAYVFPYLISDTEMEAWRSGSVVARNSARELSPADGVALWLSWIAQKSTIIGDLPENWTA